MSGNHALVFGASGLAGWAVVDELLSNYPAHGTFRKVTALVNRPLKLEDSWWPAPSPDRPELELIAGVNLLNGSVEEFTAFLKDKVKDVGAVTHVFYFGQYRNILCYTSSSDSGPQHTSRKRTGASRPASTLACLSVSSAPSILSPED